jgi:hypothetical protein
MGIEIWVDCIMSEQTHQATQDHSVGQHHDHLSACLMWANCHISTRNFLVRIQKSWIC